MASSFPTAFTLGAAGSRGTDDEDGYWRTRAFFVALLGYLYIVAVGVGAAAAVPLGLGLTLSFSGHDLWLVRVAAHLGAVAVIYCAAMVVWSTIRGFFLARPPVVGIVLGDGVAAPLRLLIANLASQLDVEAPSKIVVTHDGSSWLSIKTEESGRRAVGIYIGIATLLALPERELTATLAHELAHLRTPDARLTNFVERALERWCVYTVRFTQGHKLGALPFACVSHHFIGVLVFSLARLSRTDEIEADSAAADCTDASTLATALMRLAVESLRAEEVLWPHMERAALNGQAVPHDYCDRWRAHLSVDAPPEDQTGWYNRALHEQGSEVDSHPTVLERVYALNVRPDAFPRCETDSTGLLGADRSTIEDLVNREWQENHAAEWSLAAERGALLTEVAYHALDDANTDNTLRQASALDDLGRRSAAIDLLRPLVAAEPERDDARFELARLLLAVGNDEGVRHIDAVIESNERFRISGVAYATNFMIRKGRFDEAERYQCVARESAETIKNAARERTELTDKDEFLPHELDMPYVVRLQDILGSIDQIRVAYLVRKRLEYDLGDQIYVLAIEAPQKLFGRSLSDEELRELLESDLILPGEAEIAFLNGWESWLRPRLVGIRSACVYHAG